MFARLAAVFLALLVVVTSGMAGGRSYWCRMHEAAHSECCCQRDVKRGSDTRVESDDPCCRVQITGDQRQSAIAPVVVSLDSRALLAVAILPMVLDVPAARVVNDGLPVSARGPPVRNGPPLFVWNCSFLI